MKKVIFIITILLVFMSCEEAIGPDYYDTTIEIRLKDKTTGADLLNSAMTNAYNPNDIRVFALHEDGVKTELYNASLDAPRNFKIYPYNNNGVSLSLCKLYPYIGTSDKSEVTKTIIEWQKGIADTLTTEISRNGGSTYTDKVWYKNKVVFDVKDKSVNNTSLPYIERLVVMEK